MLLALTGDGRAEARHGQDAFLLPRDNLYQLFVRVRGFGSCFGFAK